MAGGNKGDGWQVKLRGNILSFLAKTNTAIYRGCKVAIDSTGYLVMATGTAAMKFVGIAEESCTQAEATAGATIRVRRHGIVKMVKSTATAKSDVGKLFYAHTVQDASNDEVVALAGVAAYDNPVGLCVRQEPDVPGGSVFTAKKYLMIDITPSAWAAGDVSTHASLAAQDAHEAAGIGPTITTDANSGATIDAAEFYGGLVALTYAGVASFTLATSGIAAGTQCRIVKANATAGALTITGGTLTGPQCVGDDFVGCPNDGDSVLIMCVSDDVFRVIDVCQQRKTSVVSGDDPTITSAQWLGGKVELSKAGVITTNVILPASGIPIGSQCTFVKTGSAGDVKIKGTTLVGKGVTANVVQNQDAQYDYVVIENTGVDAFQMVAHECV